MPQPLPRIADAILLSLLFHFSTGNAGAAPALERFEFSKPQMGAPFRIVLYAEGKERAEKAAARAFERVEALNQILSDYEYDSELSALSRSSGSGQAIAVSKELWHVLCRSQELALETAGAFDITVGPYTSLWRKSRRERKLPDPALMTELKACVGFHLLALDRKKRSALLKAPRMRLDLGGIAKGYVVDQALLTLKNEGIRSALVAAAGDLAVSAAPPGRHGWEVAMSQHDLVKPPSSEIVTIKNQAMATSGDLFQYVEIDGIRYSHILNPKTGVGLKDHSLVTVIAKDCITADGWATAISVLGPKPGVAAAEKHGGLAACVLAKEGGLIQTAKSKRFDRFLRQSRRSAGHQDLF